MTDETKIISLRISHADMARLDRITDRNRDPMAPSRTQVLQRGLALVLQEIEKKHGNR